MDSRLRRTIEDLPIVILLHSGKCSRTRQTSKGKNANGGNGRNSESKDDIGEPESDIGEPEDDRQKPRSHQEESESSRSDPEESGKNSSSFEKVVRCPFWSCPFREELR
jgi:hypothetical protein